ncbi:hypothetical protein C4580_05390 [Candidatus Woesearchaeota archaeon]|nr:MAG: hypothetical protein C4580_05390 [Candidatus Woesearchaeota archaeon]
MALPRKKLAIGALALALAGGIAALFPQSGSKTEGKYEKTAAAVTAEIADVSSSAVVQQLFSRVNSDVERLATQIRSGNGVIDTTQLHADIARVGSALHTAMQQDLTTQTRAERSRLTRELVDLQSRLHALDSDAEFLRGYARMHQDKLTNLQRIYATNPNFVSFCTAFTGYINTTLRAPPAQHPDWPNLMLILHNDFITGLVALAERNAGPLRIQDKSALSRLLRTYPQVMERVPAFRDAIARKL